MRKLLVVVCLMFPLAGVPVHAEAKGCAKGAVVGGAAGHVARKHGVIGAVIGCAVGRHRAKKH